MQSRRKRLRRERGGRGRGGDQHNSLTVAAKPQSAASRPFPLLSHCVNPTIQFIDPWPLRPSLRTKHDCSAHDQLVFIAPSTIDSCTKSIRRSPPHRRVAGGDAHLLVSYQTRNLEETSKHHVATGHVGEPGILRATSHAQGSNPFGKID